MSQIKKHTWKGLAVVAAMLLSVGLVTQSVFAATTVTTAAPTTVPANPAGGAYSTLSVDVVLTVGVAADLVAGSTVVLTAPAGWEFNTAAAVPLVIGGGGTLAFTSLSGTVTASTITWTVTVANSAVNTLTIDTNGPLLIRSLTSASASGNMTAHTTLGVPMAATNAGTITAGFVSGSTAGSKIVLTTSIGDVTNIRADGTTAITIQAQLFNDANNNNVLDAGECTLPHQGVIIQWTASRGTLSSSATTTTSTSTQTSAACVTTIPFRGNGTTGTANITAVVTQPVALVATANYQIVAGTITPTEIQFRDVTSSGHVAANIDTLYVTTNNVTQVRFRVRNSVDQGANGQVIQGTVDKGNIIPWTDGDADQIIDAGEVPASCADNVTTTFTSQRNKIDGTDIEGVAVFFVCAKAGQAAGPIKVTGKNLTTTMSDATTTITSAGIPNKIEATVTGNSVTVTVKDKDGNNVAEDTPVSFQVPSFTGTVAPSCALTSGGKASGSAVFTTASGGQVLVTVFWNSSGLKAGCAAVAGVSTALGNNSISAATTIGAGGGTPTPGTGAGFTGTAPARGSIGLLVTAGSTNAASLVSALLAAGCTVESLAVLEGGIWKIYINGAPAVVNAAFPGTLGATIAFFVRCAA